MASAELALRTKNDLGHKQHCMRVALWADELASTLNVSTAERELLREAALKHHDVPASKPISKPVLLGSQRPAALSNAVRTSDEILRSFQGQKDGISARAADMSHILELANTFDEQLEFFPFEDVDIDQVLQSSAEADNRDDWTVRYVLSRLQKIDRSNLPAVMPKLPAYPAVAMKLFEMLSEDDVDLRDLENAAKADQVIAGKLVQIANSAYYSPFHPIRTLSQAIAYVGLEDAKRLLLASGIQNFYSSPRMHSLWKHALEAALTAEKIAKLSKKIDPAEAFLLGLLHDVGKLAVTLLSEDVQNKISRYVAAGCQPGIAEFVLCGFDHGEAGAEILRYWEFTEELAVAVQYHHRPERTNSPMAGVLYLTEFWLDSNEDLPSNTRLAAATRLTGVSIKALENANPRPTGALLGL